MKLTGKAQEEFKKWLNTQKYGLVWRPKHERHAHIIPQEEYFNKLPQSMKWGVYVDFFDSQGIHFACYASLGDKNVFEYSYMFDAHCVQDQFVGEYFKTRDEARKSAIEQANKILNEKLKTNNKE
jgi:hypothetical protein